MVPASPAMGARPSKRPSDQQSGSVLTPGFSAKGGLNIAGATIGGDLWLDGADLTAAGSPSESVQALSGAYAHINGYVSLAYDSASTTDGRFRAEGTIDLYGAIKSAEHSRSWGQRYRAHRQRRPSATLRWSCIRPHWQRIFFLQPPDEAPIPCEVPSIRLRGATIGGQLYVSGSLGTPFESIDAVGIRVRGDLNLEGSVASVDLSGAIVDGNLVLGQNEALRLISIGGGQPDEHSSAAQVDRAVRA